MVPRAELWRLWISLAFLFVTLKIYENSLNLWTLVSPKLMPTPLMGERGVLIGSNPNLRFSLLMLWNELLAYGNTLYSWLYSIIWERHLLSDSFGNLWILFNLLFIWLSWFSSLLTRLFLPFGFASSSIIIAPLPLLFKLWVKLMFFIDLRAIITSWSSSSYERDWMYWSFTNC